MVLTVTRVRRVLKEPRARKVPLVIMARKVHREIRDKKV
jgi:hypothetical protein